jgi:L-lactate dehydrogenase complex protein LldF
MGVSHEPALPFASSLCGACGEVCPVKIDIPKVLLELRGDVKKSELREKQNRLERLAFRAFAWLMTHPRVYEMAGRIAASLAPAGDGKWISNVPAFMNLPPVRAWLSQRDLPPSPARSFRDQWRLRR